MKYLVISKRLLSLLYPNLQSFFGISFGGGAEIDIILDDADTRKMAEIKDENGRKERFFLFYDGESVTGKVSLIDINDSFV